VDQVQVNLVDVEPSQALLGLGLGFGIGAVGGELGGDEHLIARRAGLAQRASHALLVAVGLGRVDMAISQVEGLAHGVHADRPVGHPQHAEAQDRHVIPVREDPGAPVRGDIAGRHGSPSAA
jgi:hypothetical protein